MVAIFLVVAFSEWRLLPDLICLGLQKIQSVVGLENSQFDWKFMVAFPKRSTISLTTFSTGAGSAVKTSPCAVGLDGCLYEAQTNFSMSTYTYLLWVLKTFFGLQFTVAFSSKSNPFHNTPGINEKVVYRIINTK